LKDRWRGNVYQRLRLKEKADAGRKVACKISARQLLTEAFVAAVDDILHSVFTIAGRVAIAFRKKKKLP